MIRNLTVEFAAKRLSDQDQDIERLLPVVGAGLDRLQAGDDDWFADIMAEVRSIYADRVAEWGGEDRPADFKPIASAIEKSLVRTGEPDEYTDNVIAAWLAVMIENAAEVNAARQDNVPFVLQWVTMHDDKVRDTHKAADGQTVEPGGKFKVGDSEMPYPGFPVEDLAQWINCRCAVAAVAADAPIAASVAGETGHIVHAGDEEEPMPEQEPEKISRPVEPMQWHGVWAPEDVWSGDGRRFAAGSLSHRDLPLPLTWQKIQQGGHDGSVTVASAEKMQIKDGLVYAQGTFLDIPEADEVIGLMSHFGRFGVSVDADMAEGEAEFGDDGEATGRMTFTMARICSASIVNIPAFAEAYVALGPWENGEMDEADDLDKEYAALSEEFKANLVATYAGTSIDDMTKFISDSSWDGSAGRFSPEEWKRSCVVHVCDDEEKSCHKLPIREPGGELSRAGVHAAAARVNQVDAPPDKIAAAKRALRGAYKQLGEDPPDVLKAAADTEDFGRGPGWITDPIPTKRIHDYWTRPGEPGYEKIGWGVPGDFNRCRALVGEKIAENSPEDVRFLNQICAQWHHDALGFWPGRAPSEQSLNPPDGEPAPALSLVAGAGVSAVPHEWFSNPHFTERTPLTITPEGRVFGHAALWGTCHVGFSETECVEPPASPSEYAYFLVGLVDTDAGPVPVGTMTIGGGHAPLGLRSRAAAAHYDDVSTAWAYVTCGEDEHGIWYSGMLRPGLTPEDLIDIKAAKMSGDWRKIHGQYDMIGIHSVNTPGFPIPRVKVGMANGEQISLVAAVEFSTMQEHLDRQGRPDEPAGRDLDDLAAKVVDEMEAREQLRAQFAALKAAQGGE